MLKALPARTRRRDGMRKPGKPVAGLQSSDFTLPKFGKRKSFKDVEAKAREVLREKGLSEAQIKIELGRVKRKSQ
jgi:hypothetical protein